jgi:hypothetical protein
LYHPHFLVVVKMVVYFQLHLELFLDYHYYLLLLLSLLQFLLRLDTYHLLHLQLKLWSMGLLELIHLLDQFDLVHFVVHHFHHHLL